MEKTEQNTSSPGDGFLKSAFFLIPCRILEKKFQNEKQDYEKEIESLKGEIKTLKEEKIKLQDQIQEEHVIQDGLKLEVGQLKKQAKVGGIFK